MKASNLIGTTLVLACGCVTPSLERHTVNQSLSVASLRYQEVLDNLARVACNHGVLPSVAVNAGGVVTITNTAQLESATLWDHVLDGFGKETFTPLARHAPDHQWTLDPVVSQPQQEALHAAFLWALCGPPPAGSRAFEILRKPRPGDTGFHLDVADQLAALPPGWLHVSRTRGAPKGACYSARHHDVSVWVTADGIDGLSAFTLIVLDIATVDPTSLVVPQPVGMVEFAVMADKEGKDSITVTEPRAVRQVDGLIVVSESPVNPEVPAIGFGSVQGQPTKPTPRITFKQLNVLSAR